MFQQFAMEDIHSRETRKKEDNGQGGRELERKGKEGMKRDDGCTETREVMGMEW